jgi:hypothetical protein
VSAFQKWLLLGSSAATAVTGVVYGWMRYLLEPADPWAVINHPLEPWVLKAHILVAPLLVFAFGVIAVDHVWKHFRCRVPMGRRSGISAALFFAPMVVTGYLIQAVTHTGWLRALVIAHLATGAVYGAGLVLHTRLFRSRGEVRRAGPQGRRLRIERGEDGPRIVLPNAEPLRRRVGRPEGPVRSRERSGTDG